MLMDNALGAVCVPDVPARCRYMTIEVRALFSHPSDIAQSGCVPDAQAGSAAKALPPRC